MSVLNEAIAEPQLPFRLTSALKRWKLFSDSILTHFLFKKEDKIEIFTCVILSNFLEKLMDSW